MANLSVPPKTPESGKPSKTDKFKGILRSANFSSSLGRKSESGRKPSKDTPLKPDYEQVGLSPSERLSFELRAGALAPTSLETSPSGNALSASWDAEFDKRMQEKNRKRQTVIDAKAGQLITSQGSTPVDPEFRLGNTMPCSVRRLKPDPLIPHLPDEDSGDDIRPYKKHGPLFNNPPALAVADVERLITEKVNELLDVKVNAAIGKKLKNSLTTKMDGTIRSHIDQIVSATVAIKVAEALYIHNSTDGATTGVLALVPKLVSRTLDVNISHKNTQNWGNKEPGSLVLKVGTYRFSNRSVASYIIKGFVLVILAVSLIAIFVVSTKCLILFKWPLTVFVAYDMTRRLVVWQPQGELNLLHVIFLWPLANFHDLAMVQMHNLGLFVT
ncbi:hypothetical protein BS50DRAFT_581953 [Corynespora cassiicola Philippines]|uniref:Uncharacterized protein n=1 Tax=Corynespora cassiicola Philippines TaxID=1448308 RepID=A0A2T2PC40_CORCC|nr:hypothetical protein BS50DRAFT_581953 [Corynespora cassiicola Philippines]